MNQRFLPRLSTPLFALCDLALCEMGVCEQDHEWNDRLPVDYFTALSIAAHSRLSSPERAHLLITMGLLLF